MEHSLPIHHHEEKRFNACFSPYSKGLTNDKGFKMAELKSWRAVLPLERTLGCPTGLWRVDCLANVAKSASYCYTITYAV